VIIHGLWSAGAGLLLWLQSDEPVGTSGLHPYAVSSPCYDPGDGPLAQLLAPKALRGLIGELSVVRAGEAPDRGSSVVPGFGLVAAPR